MRARREPYASGALVVEAMEFLKMTYDPDRDARAPEDANPNVRPHERKRSDHVVILLTLFALFIGAGVWLYAKDDSPLATNPDAPSAERTTTGTATREPPLPDTPTPPTVPSQPRQ
ncbi:MAG: hypothetical protein AB7V13_24455 [Pseudorhodoplanes sp.]|uniref:hypothetical protein n=1 Tax=Pseudorhodoplanes sp. TaxID=1934341 RepID=UPI003D1531D8